MDNKSQLNQVLALCKNDPPLQEHQSNIDKEYVKLYKSLSSDISNLRVNNRSMLTIMMDTVFDGNLYSTEGYSNNRYIEKVQKTAIDLMNTLNENNNIVKFPARVLNTNLSYALSVVPVVPQDDQYYQNIYNRNGSVVTSKISNVAYNVKAHPQKILSLLKTSYLLTTSIISKELLSFVWVLLDVISFFIDNSTIELNDKYVVVILYIQKYASPCVLEDDLINNITKGSLTFPDIVKGKGCLSKEQARECINNLKDMHIINIEGEEISLAETVDLNVEITEN